MNKCVYCKHARTVVNKKEVGKVGCAFSLVYSKLEEDIIASECGHKYGYMYAYSEINSKDKGLMVIGLLVSDDFVCGFYDCTQ